MPRITPIEPADASGKVKQLLDAVHKKLGLTPNLMKTLAASPAALEGYLTLTAALAGGALDTRFREQIALVVAQTNACEYCLAAHTALAALGGLQPDEIAGSRAARATDSKRDAGLKFARAVVLERGQVSDAAVANVRTAGFDDTEITEIVANVAVNIFSNYINNVAQTVVDFPRVEIGVA
jgi:uncharacterized peroxidase-related enzyme